MILYKFQNIGLYFPTINDAFRFNFSLHLYRELKTYRRRLHKQTNALGNDVPVLGLKLKRG